MRIFDYFEHLTLTADQHAALLKLESFISGDLPVFMLKGYAGSGKTTLLKGLAEFLTGSGIRFILMAPTGRASRVLRDKTGLEAATIHKNIYAYEELSETKGENSFSYYFKLRANHEAKNSIYIVDEASMLSDMLSEGEFFRFGTGYLLSDLISFSRVTEPSSGSKIIFVGDPCQLPPVTDNSSKAFDAAYLKQKFNLGSVSAEIHEVKRQDAESGVLLAASRIRKSITSGFFNSFQLLHNGKDLFQLDLSDLVPAWSSIEHSKVIIAYKNKTCLEINRKIREHIYGQSDLPPRKGDVIIIGNNNYNKGILNGEFGVINSVEDQVISHKVAFYARKDQKDKNALTKHVTLHWRKAELVFEEEGQVKLVKGMILENYLYGDNYLTPDETQALYVHFKNRHQHLKPGTEEFKQAIRNDDFFNCIQLKFGYAVTCHKAQGGEWDNVFAIWDHRIPSAFTHENEGAGAVSAHEPFFRWSYTAITRARKNLYTMMAPCFHAYSSLTVLHAEAIKSMAYLKGKAETPREYRPGTEELELMKKLGLDAQPLPIKDHFLVTAYTMGACMIDIKAWNRKNSEISYLFERESETAAVKTWIDKNNRFNGKYMELPGLTNSRQLLSEVITLLENLPRITIERDTVETILERISFDYQQEEKYPFTRDLYDDLSEILKTERIKITDIEHLQFRDRYTFGKGEELAVLDFEYNASGFFGRVIPLINKSNSIPLLNDLEELFIRLNGKE